MNIDKRLAEALRLYRQGRLDNALKVLQDCQRAAPRDGRVEAQIAALFREKGQPRQALGHAQTAAQWLPQDAAIHYLLAQIYEDLAAPAQALQTLQQVLTLQPGHPEALHMQGLLMADQGRDAEAVAALSAAIRARPGYFRAWNNLGSLLRSMGRWEEAERAYREAIKLKPDYALAHYQLGQLLRDLGRREAAMASLERAYAIEPKRVDTVLSLGNLLRMEGDFDRALKIFREGVALDRPGEARVHLALAFCLRERGDVADGKRAYTLAARRVPGDLRAALGEALSLPAVYADRAELAAVRASYGSGVASLLDRAGQWAGKRRDDVLPALQWSNFYLAYQGEDDLALQRGYAQFVYRVLQGVAPELIDLPPRKLATQGKPRIGLASSFFTDSTVGHYFKRWVTGLDRTRFAIHVYHLRPGDNAIAAEIRAHAEVFRDLGHKAPGEIVQTLRGDALDVLIYPELGMDSTCFLLAAMRLAPVQCAAWGHPVTTGHANIDYYFTSAAMEPAAAQAHYSEKLIELPGIGTSYPRPPRPTPRSRVELGLPETGELLLLPQSLYKIHPDNDPLLGHILAARPSAHLILFQGRHPNITGQLHARLKRALTAAGTEDGGRIHFLPYVPRERYLQINQACDLMLDTLHWSGGNTSLDALACHLPMVTLPGAFMRGRQSAAMLEIAGVPDLVARDAEDYVARVLALLADPVHRTEVAARLAKGADRLFDDPAPIHALQEFLAAVTSGAPPAL